MIFKHRPYASQIDPNEPAYHVVPAKEKIDIDCKINIIFSRMSGYNRWRQIVTRKFGLSLAIVRCTQSKSFVLIQYKSSWKTLWPLDPVYCFLEISGWPDLEIQLC